MSIFISGLALGFTQRLLLSKQPVVPNSNAELYWELPIDSFIPNRQLLRFDVRPSNHQAIARNPRIGNRRVEPDPSAKPRRETHPQLDPGSDPSSPIEDPRTCTSLRAPLTAIERPTRFALLDGVALRKTQSRKPQPGEQVTA